MVTKRTAKNADKDRKIFTPNQKISYASVPSCINRNDSSLTNHDLRKRLFKKKCYYCGMPLDESEKSYPVREPWQNQGKKHWQNDSHMYCSICHNLRLNRWRQHG